MTQGGAVVRGFLSGMAGITLVGAIWGGIVGASPCGRADFFTGAIFGGIGFLIIYSIPAGVFGVLLWAYVASLAETAGPPATRKPDPHPLDD